MYELVRVGTLRLIGEIIRLDGETATIQASTPWCTRRDVTEHDRFTRKLLVSLLGILSSALESLFPSSWAPVS